MPRRRSALATAQGGDGGAALIDQNAVFSVRPGIDLIRPLNRTPIANLFLAGDWTRTGWPATMEGAVRSGYIAAEQISTSAGASRTFLLPDIA